MQLKLRIFIACLMVAGVFAYTIFPVRWELESPRMATPAIMRADATLTVTLRHSLPFATDAWRFQLQTSQSESKPVVEFPLTIKSRETQLSRSVFQLTLPEDIPPGGYNLTVAHADERATSFKAVHIVERFKRDLKVIQLADLPTLGEGDGDDRLRRIIGEVNLINPDLVLFTGDIVYGATWRQYQLMYEQLKAIRAPLVLAPGNHEYYGWAGYLTTFGRPYHRVDYGDFSIISLNSGHGRDQLTQSQFRWFELQLQNSVQSQRIVQLHHPIHHRTDLTGYLRFNARRVVDLINQHKVSVVLSGHWHGDSIYDQLGNERNDTWRVDGTPYVVTTAAGADLRPKYSTSPLHYGYRLLRYHDAELENFTYDYDGDGVRDPSSSIPMDMISVEKRGRYALAINNKLNEGFSDAMVSIEVPEVGEEFQPSTGRVESYKQMSTHTLYNVILDIPAQRELLMTMAKQDVCQ